MWPFGNPVAFGCNRCGECCRYLDIQVSQADILRIRQACPDLGPTELFVVYPAEPGHPEAILIDGKFQLLLLRKRPVDQSCVCLEPDLSCRIYAVRPRACQGFPFELEGERSLRIAPSAQTLYEVACDKTSFRKVRATRSQIQAGIAEFEIFRSLTRAWNESVAHSPALQTLAGFLDFITLAR